MDYTGFETGGYDEDAYQEKVDFEPPRQSVQAIDVSQDDVLIKSERKKTLDLSSIIGTMGVKMASPNTELTEEHATKAKLAYSAKLSPEDADAFLAHNQIDKTIVDRSRYGIMLKDNETGKYTLALRGMRPTDPRDILNVARQTSGSYESYDVANEMIEKVLSNGGEVEHIVGFSMGGATALDIATERQINATTFDPPINPRMVLRNSLATRPNKATIEVIRNPENFISIGTAFRNVSLNPGYKVSVVPVGESGVFANHELMPNFIKPQLDTAEMKAKNMVEVANKFAQHETLFDMKRAMDSNKTFTEFYRELNSRGGQASGIDVDVDGFNTLGVRVNENAPIVKLWKLIGGQFNEYETEHLRTATPSPTTQDIVAERDILQHIKDGQLEIAETKAQERFTSAVNVMNADEVLSHPAVKSSVSSHIQNAIHPVNMATGMISAFAGEEAMRMIDPSGSFGQYNEGGVLEHTAVSGSLTGAFSDILMNGLSGGTGLVSQSLLGISTSAGIGAVAGEATRYGVDKGLNALGANSDTREAVSDVSGGIVGGATATLSGDALAIASASLTGAEIGELAGPAGVLVGAGVGMVFSLGAYGLAKLGQVPAVKKAEKKVGRELLKDWSKIKSWF